LLTVDEFNLYDAVCLDCFDTLLIRNVDAEYIKIQWCGKLKAKFQIDQTVDDLYFLRNRIEGTICGENYNIYGAGEFKYKEMLQQFFDALKSLEELKNIDFETFNDCALHIEFELEHPTLSINKELTDRLAKVKSPLYLVSDFYHSQEFIKKLLKVKGLNLEFKDYFVSSETIKTKRDGTLYDLLNDTIKPSSPEKLLMVGDNLNSDCVMAKTRGFSALHLPQDEYRKELWGKSAKSCNKKALVNQLSDVIKKDDFAYFKELPLTIYFYIEKLIYAAKKDRVKNLLCMAREGQVLKILIDKYIAANNIEGIKTHYFYTSRASSLLPSLDVLEKETFKTIARQYSNISISSFCFTLGINKEIGEKVAKEINASFEDKIPAFFRSNEFKALKENTLFAEEFEKNRIAQKEKFSKYIFSMVSEDETIGLVDVGWKGTIQDHIYKALDQKCRIKGYYIGLDQVSGVNEKNIKEGIVFTMYPVQSECFNIYRMNKPLFETLLSADHGSTQSYEYSEDGQVKPVLLDNPREIEIYTKYIEPYRNFMVDKFDEIIKFFDQTPWSSLEFEQEVHKFHTRMILRPKTIEMKYFTNIKHFENFGDITFSTFEASWSLKELFYFLRRPKSYLRGRWWMTLTVYQILGQIGVFFFSLLAKPYFSRGRSKLN
jgi:predicted HAD superfamily hydrolase